jgi:hypothetical protein
MKKIFIIIALLAGHLAYSQPGYQGHKFLILYDFNVSPALLNYNAQGEKGFTSFNLIQQVKLEYAWRRKINIGVQGSYDKTSLNVTGFGDESRPIKSNNYGFGLYAKRFSSDDANMAPRGSYFQFGIGAQYVSIYDDRNKNNLHSYIGNFSVSCGFGKQSILYKRIMIDYGITFSLNSAVLFPLKEVFLEDASNSSSSSSYDGTGELDKDYMNDTSKLQKQATYNSLASNIVAVKIGIGLLP